MVHLAAAAGRVETGRGAVPDHYIDPAGLGTPALKQNYDKSALLDPHWAEKTLCGRVWVSMASGEGGLLHEFDVQEAFVPTCKRCLALMDRLFPAPRPDDRLALVTQIVTDRAGPDRLTPAGRRGRRALPRVDDARLVRRRPSFRTSHAGRLAGTVGPHPASSAPHWRWPGRPEARHRRTPETPGDAEVICLAVAQAHLGFTSERRWLRAAPKQVGHLIPRLMSPSEYNSRLPESSRGHP
jgi:hypothetical protein